MENRDVGGLPLYQRPIGTELAFRNALDMQRDNSRSERILGTDTGNLFYRAIEASERELSFDGFQQAISSSHEVMQQLPTYGRTRPGSPTHSLSTESEATEPTPSRIGMRSGTLQSPERLNRLMPAHVFSIMLPSRYISFIIENYRRFWRSKANYQNWKNLLGEDSNGKI